jgi:hypothetical protein
MLVACSSALLIFLEIWKYPHSHWGKGSLDSIIYVRVKWSHYSIVYRPRLDMDLERSTKIGRKDVIVDL